jgi:hypothetical protein
MNIQVSLDSKGYNQKPTSSEIGAIVNRIATQQTTISVEELVNASINGQTVAPLFRDGIKSNATWIGQQVFYLDFDNKDMDNIITFSEVLERAKKYGLSIAFAYTTFSAEYKFRIGFIAPVLITDIRVRNVIQEFLTVLFPEHDTSTNVAHMMVFGGRTLLYADYDATLDLEVLTQAVFIYLKNKDSKNLDRNMKGLCDRLGLHMLNGAPRIIVDEDIRDFEENTTVTIIYPMVDVMISSKTITYYFNHTIAAALVNEKPKKSYGKIDNVKVKERELIRDVDYAELTTICPVMRDHDKGIDIHHDVTFYVATQVIHLMGGETFFFNGLRKRATYNEDKWKGIIAYIKKMDYKPMNYDKIKHYYGDLENETGFINSVSIANKERGMIEVLKQQTQITLDEAEIALHNAFNDAMNATENGIYVIRADTGLGKTREYESVENTTIAVPTHALKREVLERMIVAGNTALISPELPDDISSEIKSTVENLYRIGAIKAANVYLRNAAKTDPLLAEYIEQKDETAKVNGQNLITTHARLFHLPKTNDTIVIDEDIISSMYPQNHASLKDVLFMEEIAKPKGFGVKVRKDMPMNSIVQFIREALPFIVYPMPNYKLTPQELKEIETAVINKKLSSNVIGLLSATHIYKTMSDTGVDNVYYIQRKELPKDKKIIIMSATANEEVYKLVFGNRLISFADTGKVALKGKIQQMIGINASRSALTQNPENIERIKDFIVDILGENATIITYKAFVDKFNAAANFGGVIGSDIYKGRDIAIVGTPNFNEVVYLLLASALDVRITPEFDDTLAYKQITRNGFRFDFMTYTRNELLREIQLYLIESELQQAIGRARLTRHDCLVLVFSNLPISGAKIVVLKDNDKKQTIRKIERQSQHLAA